MSAEAEIRRRIRRAGAVTFAEFMELALFWPGGGYYMVGDPIGEAGDYYTSSSVHPAFGALLAVQLFQMWQLLDRPRPFTVVELGAGNGLLCRDVVEATKSLPPGFAQSLSYLCLDRRAAIGIEPKTVEEGTSYSVSRLAAAGLPLRGIVGCVLSNEYLDAFPVHQVVMAQDALQEVYVKEEDGQLVSAMAQPSTPALAQRLVGLGIRLQVGQTAEINLGIGPWAQEVASALTRGFVLTIDYGHPAAELYSPQRRRRGTLTTFYKHTQLDAPLRHVGHQDITSQVDFTSVVEEGRRYGLDSLGFVTQGEFLERLGLKGMLGRLGGLGLPQREAQANRAGMVDLGRPGGLGDFKVLVQSKGAGKPELWGFGPSERVAKLVNDMPVPLLTPQHLSLTERRYPGTDLEFEVDWLQEDG